MRLLKLHLAAFGSFEGRVLDFSAKPHALSIVFGKNEAGKSTSLRAYEGLLFGIDSTADAFRHPTKKLRVGGTFADDDGQLFTVFRRRGRKDTLIDEGDKPIDESNFKRLLRGVDRELFAALYGLNHVRLREGKKALFAEGSSVAEGLFEASLSGAGVGQLAKALRAEAEALFTPRATQRPLNEALRAYGAAVSNTRTYGTSASTYRTQLEGIESAKEDRRHAEEELLAFDRARRHLERGKRVAPLLWRRRELCARRNELGQVARLPESAAQDRERSQTERREADDTIALLTEERRRLSAELGAFPELDLPFDPGEARAELSELLGGARDAALRRPELAAERVALAALVSEQTGQVRVLDAAAERSLLDLVLARDEARRASSRAQEQLAEEEALAAAAAASLDAISLKPAQQSERLRLLVDAAESALARAGQRDAELARAAERESRAQAIGAALNASVPLGELPERPAPANEEIEELRRRHQVASRSVDEIRLRVVELEQQRVLAGRERAELLSRGPAISEADLDRARNVRDQELEAAFATGDATSKESARRALREADALSDRLRLEADRLARLSAVERSLEAIGASLLERSAQATLALDAAETADASVRRLLALGGGPELDPQAAVSWFARRSEAVEAWLMARASRAAARAIEDDAVGATKSLVALLARAPADGEPFARLRAAISDGRAELADDARERARADKLLGERDAARANAIRATLRRNAAEATAREAAQRVDTALAELGLGANATREELARAAQETRRAAEAAQKLRKLEAQLERDQALVSRLAQKTEEIGRALALPALPGDRVAAAELLVSELSRAHRSLDAKREIARRLSESDERLRMATDRKRRADVLLAESVARAAVGSEAELPLAEERSVLARKLDHEIESLESSIQAAAGATPTVELEAEFAGFDVDQAELEDQRLEDERERLERRKEAATQQRVSLEQAVGQLHESRAAGYAEQAAQHFARARALAARYARLRLASAILEREVEAYQKLHQAPVVARASEHFRALTGGVYDSVRVTLNDDDQPELTTLRAGNEVSIEGLSDGAKDQLFLALRLATIERHAERVESLPLVFDDVLVHFDDERSLAALSLFASIAPRMQVLLFTHQARVVELARALDPDSVQIVELDAPSTR